MLPLRWVLVRDPEGRFDPQALLSTDPALTPEQIVGYYVRRWQVEVTFAEARRHLGVESQRQWSDRAIARTTPVLFGLFSLVMLLAAALVRGGHLPVRAAAWYPKRSPTFSDALAAVRAHWWRAGPPVHGTSGSCRSPRADSEKSPRTSTAACARRPATPREWPKSSSERQ